MFTLNIFVFCAFDATRSFVYRRLPWRTYPFHLISHPVRASQPLRTVWTKLNSLKFMVKICKIIHTVQFTPLSSPVWIRIVEFATIRHRTDWTLSNSHSAEFVAESEWQKVDLSSRSQEDRIEARLTIWNGLFYFRLDRKSFKLQIVFWSSATLIDCRPRKWMKMDRCLSGGKSLSRNHNALYEARRREAVAIP